MDTILTTIDNIVFILLIYLLICMISSIVSLWKIFEKEGIVPYYSLIPGLNVYHYFKICGLPFWTFFVPIVNIIVLYCSPYIIVKKYRCKKWQIALAIPFPFVMMPYIAFSDLTNLYTKHENIYVKNNLEIDKLEEKLVRESRNELDEKEIVASNEEVEKTATDKFVSDIEDSIIVDEYVYDDYQEIESEYQPVDNDVNEFIEYDDDIDMNSLNISDVDILEDNIAISSSVEKTIVKDIVDYKESDLSSEAIAFGGEKKIENLDSMKTKNDELKCSRCGSSLVGATDTCPGCGMKLN